MWPLELALNLQLARLKSVTKLCLIKRTVPKSLKKLCVPTCANIKKLIIKFITKTGRLQSTDSTESQTILILRLINISVYASLIFSRVGDSHCLSGVLNIYCFDLIQVDMMGVFNICRQYTGPLGCIKQWQKHLDVLDLVLFVPDSDLNDTSNWPSRTRTCLNWTCKLLDLDSDLTCQMPNL